MLFYKIYSSHLIFEFENISLSLVDVDVAMNKVDVVVGATVVDVVIEVVVVPGIVVEVVDGIGIGQSKGTGVPTAAVKIASESVAVVRSSPFISQTHSKQVSRLIAARRANSESEATGSPSAGLIGCPQSGRHPPMPSQTSQTSSQSGVLSHIPALH